MFTDPQKNLEQFGLEPGMQVADLGAGSGFYSLPSAKIVTDTGKVFAVEVQKDLLGRLKNLASGEHLYNVEVVWGDVERNGGTRLRDSSIDRVIVSNLLFQIEKRDGFSSEVARILKSGGKALIIDWSDSSSLAGPGLKQVVGKDLALRIFEKVGFVLEKEIDAGEHHYGLVLVKK